MKAERATTIRRAAETVATRAHTASGEHRPLSAAEQLAWDAILKVNTHTMETALLLLESATDSARKDFERAKEDRAKKDPAQVRAALHARITEPFSMPYERARRALEQAYRASIPKRTPRRFP